MFILQYSGNSCFCLLHFPRKQLGLLSATLAGTRVCNTDDYEELTLLHSFNRGEELTASVSCSIIKTILFYLQPLVETIEES